MISKLLTHASAALPLQCGCPECAVVCCRVELLCGGKALAHHALCTAAAAAATAAAVSSSFKKECIVAYKTNNHIVSTPVKAQNCMLQ
jgi:hypothetical protein